MVHQYRNPSVKFIANKDNFNKDIWSLFLLLKVLVVYHDCSNDERIEEAVYKALKFLDGYIDIFTPYNWAGARWFECIIAIDWLYRRRKEKWLISLARRLKCFGFDYQAIYPEWTHTRRTWDFDNHVVNIAMALKSEAVYCNLLGTKTKGLAKKMLKNTNISLDKSFCRGYNNKADFGDAGII